MVPSELELGERCNFLVIGADLEGMNGPAARIDPSTRLFVGSGILGFRVFHGSSIFDLRQTMAQQCFGAYLL